MDTTEERPPGWPDALLESRNRDGVDVAHGLSPSAPTDRGIPRPLLRLMELDLKAPDHTTLSRRNKDVDVLCPTRVHDGALDLSVDSKGLKISDAGE